MLKKTSVNLLKASSFIFLTLAFMPGCEFFKKNTASSEAATPAETGVVLCKLNGNPVINEADFNSKINQMLQANPYFRGAGAQSLPPAIKRRFFDELIKEELVIADATKSNLEQDAEFKKAFEDMQKLMKRSLIVQFFEKRIYDGIVIPDAEVEAHYNENKERYVKSAGGVLVGAVRFDTDREADAFESKAKSADSYEDFEKIAKEKNAQFRSFGRLNNKEAANDYQTEGAPEQIKETALAAHHYPLITKVKVGKDIWVIHASDKKEAEMFDLNEIKPQVINMLKNNKFREKLDEEIKNLRSKMSIDVNEDFFKEKKSDDHEGHNHEHHAGVEKNPAAAA